MVAGCAVRHSALRCAGLELAGPIGGASDQHKMAGRRWMPLIGPEDPGVLRKWRGEVRFFSGVTRVCSHFKFLNKALSPPKQAPDFSWRGQKNPSPHADNTCGGM